MESMVDALKMIFAVLVFVIAITITFTVFSQAKDTSDLVFFLNDKTNFEEQLQVSDSNIKIVGIETVIPTIARYIEYNENYSVEIRNRNGETIVVFDLLEDQESNRTVRETKQRLEEELEKLIKNYSDRNFSERYSEELYRGEIYTTSIGETFETVNTNTKIRIVYQLVN